MGVERAAQFLDHARQGIRKVAVFATPEAMPRHHHPAAENSVAVIAFGDTIAIGIGHKARQDRPALPVQFGRG